MTPLRILLVGDFARKRLQRDFNNTEHKLMNGLVRLGHFVLPFSDRDVARESTLLGRRRAGARRMNEKLLETATHFKPAAVLFGHVDMTGPETFAGLRERLAGVRLAQFNLDSTERRATMASLAERARHLDMTFITTGDLSSLEAASSAGPRYAFFPNPVDASVEVFRVFAQARDELACDGIFLGTGIERRDEQLRHLLDTLPEDYRFHYGGGVLGTPRLRSMAFQECLASAAVSPNLPLDDSRPVAYLYASTRIAQLMGNGLLALTKRSARLSELYDEGVIEYDSRDELSEAMTALWRDDAERRRRAELGWRLAHQRHGAMRVGKYMLEAMLGRRFSETYEWPLP
jgi:hypothetical protein